MLLKATTGTIMGFTFSKSEMILTPTLKSLDGISKRAELKKISKPMLSDQASSILLALFLTLGEITNLSLELSQLESKELSNTILSLSKILSMIT